MPPVCLDDGLLKTCTARLTAIAGQIFWVGSMAPAKVAHFLSYFVGAFAFCGWVLGAAGCVVYTGDFLAALGVVITDTYAPEEYQIYLIALTNLVVAFVLNTWLVRLLPGLNKSMVVFLNTAAVYTLIVLLVKAHPKASAHDAFLRIVNETGWSSDGFVFLLGFLPGLLTVTLPDAAARMAEEVPNPAKTIPLVMFATSLLNAVAGLAMVTVLIFCTVKPENLLHPLGGLAAVQLAHDAWPNKGWVITFTIVQSIVPLNGASAIITGASRILWAFAKIGGLPAGSWIGATDSHLKVPVNAVLLTCILSALLSLLVFGPYTVLNGIFGSSGVCLATSYLFPILFMLVRGRKSLPPVRHFNLGPSGPVINVLALAWLSLVVVVICLPTYSPVTLDAMNWASAVCGGILILVLVNWFVVKRSFKIPKPIFVAELHLQS